MNREREPMHPNAPETYAPIIKKLKRRRALILSLTVIAYVLLFFLANPWEVTLMEKTYTYGGWPGLLSVPLALVILFVALVSYGFTILPIDRALDEECDPYKCLTLYQALGTKRMDDPRYQGIHCTCLLLMGRFEEALPYAKGLTQQKNPMFRAEGHYFCGSLAYYLGDTLFLKEALRRYQADLALAYDGMKEKTQAIFDSRGAMLAVMEGLCDGNHQAVAQALPEVKPWSPSPSVSLQMDLLRGIAAFPRPDGGDRDEAVHHFMSVKEKGGRTCLVSMAEWYLAQLKQV